jgi:hypothetical protein
MGTTARRQPARSPKGRIGAGFNLRQDTVPTRSWAEHYAAVEALRETCPREAHAALGKVIRKGNVKAVFEGER